MIVFTKPVEAASATNSSNYVFTNGLPVTAASLSTDTVTVTLTTAPLVYGSNYCLVINNVRDRVYAAQHHRHQHARPLYGHALRRH